MKVSIPKIQNEFSHDNIDMNANDQSKHQPEPEIGTENPNGPKSEGTDGGDTSINVPGDYVGTDAIFVTDGTGPKEVMGGSDHSKNKFAHKNNDMNSYDQYTQGPKTDFGTDNPKRPELEGTDDGNVELILFLHKRVLLMTKVMNLQYCPI